MASIKLNNIYINDWLTITGPMESNSRLKKIDIKMDDYYLNEDTFEQAEIKMQRIVIDNLLSNNNLIYNDIDLIVGGDLLDQISGISYSCINNSIPTIGIYSACASFPESLIISSLFLKSGNMKKILSITNSHNKAIERQFRYPIEYGIVKPHVATSTITSAISTLLSKEQKGIKIESVTIGKIVEMGVTDANNMGAIMAPAASLTLHDHLNDLKRDVSYYDLILTGDLGNVGSKIFKEYCLKNYNLKFNNYLDAGCEIYQKSDEVYAGGSGPTCLPLVLFNKIIFNKKYKKILIIGTGALHSKTMASQGLAIPAISHAVSLEVL